MTRHISFYIVQSMTYVLDDFLYGSTVNTLNDILNPTSSQHVITFVIL